MNPAEQRAYSRGYNAGSRTRWPEIKPPIPPNAIIGGLVESLRELRDTADSIVATFDPEDEVMAAFDLPIARADRALEALSRWLKTYEAAGFKAAYAAGHKP